MKEGLGHSVYLKNNLLREQSLGTLWDERIPMQERKNIWSPINWPQFNWPAREHLSISFHKSNNSAHFYNNFDCCIIMKFLSLLKVWSISVLLLSLLDHIWLEHTFTLVFMHHPCNSWVFRCVINQKINFSDLCL